MASSTSRLLLLILALLMFVGGRCVKTDDPTSVIDDESNCAEESTIGGVNPPINHSSVLGDTRTFIYEDVNVPQDICTEHHIELEYTAFLTDLDIVPSDMKIQAKAYWGGAPKLVNMERADVSREVSGKHSIGMKDLYPGKKGWIGTSVVVTFPTKGSEELDLAYLEKHIRKILIEWEYFKHIGI